MNFSAAATIAPLIGTVAYDFDPNLIWNLSSVVGVVVLAGFYLLNKRNAPVGERVADGIQKQSS